VRAVTNQDPPVHLADPPTGLAFSISDLLLMKEWADRHNTLMTIELDQRVDEEDCEELIKFRANVDSSCFLLIWRNAGAILVQPLVGRRLRYRSTSHLLDNLIFTHLSA
jgi:hypothetical protein